MTQNKQQKPQKKHHTRRRKQLRQAKRSTAALFLLFIGIERLVVTSPLYTIKFKKVTTTNEIGACSPNTVTVFTLVLTQSTPISFNIDSAQLGTLTKFIPDGSNVKQYPAYVTGSDCRMHSNTEDIEQPIFIIFLENNGNTSPTSEKCKISKIFTKGPIVPCSGTPQALIGDIWSLLDRTGSPALYTAFTTVKLSSGVSTYVG